MTIPRAASLLNLLVRFWHHLSRRRQRHFMLLGLLMLISAFAETLSLGAVLPFLVVLTSPTAVLKHRFIADQARAWGITSPQQLVLPFTLLFVAAVLAAGVIRMLLVWTSTRLAFAGGADISIEVYRRTLYQPYPVHVARNSSEMISGITNKVADSVAVLLAVLTLGSSMVLIVAVIATLILIDPFVAMVAAVSFGGCYAIITLFSRRRLRVNSQRIAHEQTQVVKAIQEGLGGIRDVLLDGTQPAYCELYRRADAPLRKAQGNNVFIGASPRYAMEALGMVLIAALAYGLSQRAGGVATALPVLGALALGAQRLLPALQQGYGAWATIAGSQAALTTTIALLDQPVRPEPVQPDPLPFRDGIRFDSVHFRYAADGPWVLDGLTLAIPKGARVGLVGSTGSGKSTTLDLLMGLLSASQGEVMVDGQPLRGDRVRAWQRTIAHVPQSIYLADTSIAENIAFGVPRDAIDMERVRLVARQAHIADFIESEPAAYAVVVGERGIRLSGGQRQRIGIARALYKQASVLVFDEATSALDNATEQSVMETIEGLSHDLTILLVAHRLTTVQRCDIVVELEHGRVVAEGTYSHLLECSPSFRKMAGVMA